MQKVFDEVNSLDKRCYEKYALSEDILMEHAASSMMQVIEASSKNKKDKTVLIVAGAGNNGADGIALARLLYTKYTIKLYIPFGVKSTMAKLQLQRVEKLGLTPVYKVANADIVVDCLFGSGLNRKLNTKSLEIIRQLNQLDGYKIACDIPSGINHLGEIQTDAFQSDTTITMGALKISLFSDSAKEFVGEIKVANLGIQRELYETQSNIFLLDKDDIKLPFRNNSTSHKGTYGHLSVVVGEKKGAALLAAEAGFAFGCGLISVVAQSGIKKLSPNIMQSSSLPKNTTALCIGMGLGKVYDTKFLQNDIAKVIDADLFYDKKILTLLERKNVVLTPHPKEFCSLLKLTKIDNITIQELQNNRLKYLQIFTKKYPKVTILLKGTNVLIGENKKVYINRFGTSVLSKGGSGDVLTGLIGSLLAQGYSSLEATITGSLAHTIAAMNYKKNNYSLTPLDLIEQIKKL